MHATKLTSPRGDVSSMPSLKPEAVPTRKKHYISVTPTIQFLELFYCCETCLPGDEQMRSTRRMMRIKFLIQGSNIADFSIVFKV
jgi:hypothetical protein